jgi:hypothetical protein
MKTKSFREYLETRFTKEQIAKIEEDVRREVEEIREAQKCLRPNAFDVYMENRFGGEKTAERDPQDETDAQNFLKDQEEKRIMEGEK